MADEGRIQAIHFPSLSRNQCQARYCQAVLFRLPPDIFFSPGKDQAIRDDFAPAG